MAIPRPVSRTVWADQCRLLSTATYPRHTIANPMDTLESMTSLHDCYTPPGRGEKRGSARREGRGADVIQIQDTGHRLSGDIYFHR